MIFRFSPEARASVQLLSGDTLSKEASVESRTTPASPLTAMRPLGASRSISPPDTRHAACERTASGAEANSRSKRRLSRRLRYRLVVDDFIFESPRSSMPVAVCSPIVTAARTSAFVDYSDAHLSYGLGAFSVDRVDEFPGATTTGHRRHAPGHAEMARLL